MGNILLSSLVFSPLLAILVMAFIPSRHAGVIKQVGIFGTLPALILAGWMFGMFNYETANLQFVEKHSWISIPIGMAQAGTVFAFEINYELGIDGISMPLILLTAIIGTLAAIASWQIKKRQKEYFILFHLLLIGMLGVFAADNLFLFFIFFELTLVPMYFLIGIWGYGEREQAANKFLLYNGIGSGIMLLAFIVIFVIMRTLNIDEITAILTTPGHPITEILTPEMRFGIFLVLFIAFAIKLPVFPFHTWMLRVHVQAPPSIVMIHSGILLKMGAYGLLRMGIGFFPEQAYDFSTWMAVLGIINILYGAVLAFVQKDLKMVLAYSSISHMGIVLLGFASMNTIGFQGAMFQVVSHGFISALLFFLIGVIWDRTQTSMLDDLGGLAKSMPFVSGVLLAGGMASLGLPGMSGFISEFFAFLGLFGRLPVMAAVGAIGIVLTAVYLLRAILKTTFGPTPGKCTGLADAQPMEVIPMVVLMGCIILIGVYPAVLGNPMQQALKTIVPIVTGIGG
ncbi:NADH-quinone oxidoreductase subunit M [Brevibacillus antibioticus]|uniref:NADH-quinone oxidoreductase subunit M n=1 Tax=Brevibacillus antibioticus TaxID=2570228 RepID=A0A4V5TJ95_9BACL|nr:NADH-quinone oxidoreductase subunit M [Brevibacillus antibioticus]TKI58543.1 NADH-quinone oxidoreductase subunit M [Brevibacillus antibioticus]